MEKYHDLIAILDTICQEAPSTYKRYHPELEQIDDINKARALAFVHLYLKVKFGLTDFTERDQFVTDGTDDGGVDGYYIDVENKVLYFMQSKFRVSSQNFESKEITFEELLSMDIGRITKGETTYEDGKAYNGKILQFINKLQNISDLPKYKFVVVLLANVRESYSLN